MIQAKNLFSLIAFFILTTSVIGQNIFPPNANVGIGTTSPQQKLHVHSNTFSAIEISGAGAGILFAPASTSSTHTAAIGLTTSNLVTPYLNGSSIGDLNLRSGAGKRLLFGTLDQNTGIGTIRMEIMNNGRVNIGSGAAPDPFAKLNVEGALAATGAIRNRSVKLDANQGYLKLRKYNNGEDLVWKNALAPSSAAVAELQVNPGGAFANGTRIMGGKLVVDGNLGLGTSDTRGFKLAVKGKILSEELKIRTYANWPDYVFADDYQLISLAELEYTIAELGHLPGLPSAGEVEANGFEVGEMNAQLLEKVEELTLYMIELNKKVELLEAEKAQWQKEHRKN